MLRVGTTVNRLWFALLWASGLRIRHLLVEKEGRPIGLLSAGDVMKATLEMKNRELKALNAMVSWDYYEDWRWKPRK